MCKCKLSQVMLRQYSNECPLSAPSDPLVCSTTCCMVVLSQSSYVDHIYIYHLWQSWYELLSPAPNNHLHMRSYELNMSQVVSVCQHALTWLDAVHAIPTLSFTRATMQHFTISTPDCRAIVSDFLLASVCAACHALITNYSWAETPWRWTRISRRLNVL